MSSTKNLSVLIVEDNCDAADTLAHCLLASGYDRTKVAYTPYEAAQIVRAGFFPDVIFLDIGLPEMDGFAVAKDLCTVLPRKPLIVAITGYSDTTDRSQQEGFDLHPEADRSVQPDRYPGCSLGAFAENKGAVRRVVRKQSFPKEGRSTILPQVP